MHIHAWLAYVFMVARSAAEALALYLLVRFAVRHEQRRTAKRILAEINNEPTWATKREISAPDDGLPGAEPSWYPPTPRGCAPGGGYRPLPPPPGRGDPVPIESRTGAIGPKGTPDERDGERAEHPWVKRGDL